MLVFIRIGNVEKIKMVEWRVGRIGVEEVVVEEVVGGDSVVIKFGGLEGEW